MKFSLALLAAVSAESRYFQITPAGKVTEILAQRNGSPKSKKLQLISRIWPTITSL